ncbi:sensor histidine kinase, partial [Cribrihabitans sp. XS_ASV171]
LETAGVYNVVLRRDEVRQLMLASPVPAEISATYDLRMATPWVLMRDAILQFATSENQVVRVIGEPVKDAGLLIEVAMETAPLRAAMIDYGLRILVLSLVISVMTAFLLFLAVRIVLVRPIRSVVGYMQRYAQAPEDARGIIQPRSSVRELREAEEALQMLQIQITQALKQRERLAQLGGAVAKVSHDLRNILTSAQLFTDRIEASEDPLVRRMAPKLVNSITRAVSLCESTLAFGRAEEPAPTLTMLRLRDLAEDVCASERLALDDSGVEIENEVPEGFVLRADPEQMFRVLLNLVRNARQALMSTGKAGRVTVSAHEDADHWRVEVTDTGPGLPPKAREHLFTAFQGGARKGGSGLGLAISAELIRGHGGELVLHRSDDNGTAFEIRLPKGDLTF